MAYVVLLVALVVWTRRLWQGRERTWLAPAWVLHSIFWGLLVYWALRNVPGWTWLSPV